VATDLSQQLRNHNATSKPRDTPEQNRCLSRTRPVHGKSRLLAQRQPADYSAEMFGKTIGLDDDALNEVVAHAKQVGCMKKSK
jgi:hypothetical protein